MITHFLKFTDEATAKAALPDYWLAYTDDDGSDAWTWRRDVVDGPIAIMKPSGAVTVIDGVKSAVMMQTVGYHLIIGLPKIDPKIAAASGFLGAMDDDGNTVAGTPPIYPKRVFMRNPGPLTKLERSIMAIQAADAKALANGNGNDAKPK